MATRSLIPAHHRAGSWPRKPDIQVSILTNHPDMAIADVVWAIFRRWLQENDFRYLDSHFGFNQMTSRDSLRFSEQADQFRDRPVDSPEDPRVKDALQALESKLGRQLVQLRKCVKEGRDLKLEQAILISRKAALESRLATAIDQLRNERSPLPHGSRRMEEVLTELRTRYRKSEKIIRANAARKEDLQSEIAHLETEIDPMRTPPVRGGAQAVASADAHRWRLPSAGSAQ